MKNPITVVKEQNRKLEQMFQKNSSASNFNITYKSTISIFQSALLARKQKQYQKSISLFQQAHESICNYKGSLSQKQVQMFLQIRISTLSNLLAQYLLFGRQHESYLKQTISRLRKNIKYRSQFQVASYFLFGTRSLLALLDFQFEIGTNDLRQLEYDQLAHAYFWHTVGKLKKLKYFNHKQKQSKTDNNRQSSVLNNSRAKRINQYKKYVDRLKDQDSLVMALRKSLDICVKNNYRNLARQNINLLQQILPGFLNKQQNSKYKIIYSNALRHVTECVGLGYVLDQMIQIEQTVQQIQYKQGINLICPYSAQFIKTILTFSIKVLKKQNKNNVTNQSNSLIRHKLRQQRNILVLKNATKTKLFQKSLGIYQKNLQFILEKIKKVKKFLQLHKSFGKILSFNRQQCLKTPNKDSTNGKNQSMMKYPWATSNNSKTINSEDTKKKSKAKKQPNYQSIKKQWKQCLQGQYVIKYNYNNDDKKIKFLQLTQNQLRWSDSETRITTQFSSYKLKYVKGIVYGAVSMRFKIQKDKIEPWKCFSIIGADRTLDFYCKGQQKDVLFWLPGITYHMKTFISANFQLYSVGRAIWKMITLKAKTNKFWGKKLIKDSQYTKNSAKKQKQYTKIPYKVISSYRIQIGDFQKIDKHQSH